MATPPVFSVGATLTAAQMNAVGMWQINTTTVGTGVSSVNLSSVFSSDYDRYKIVYQGGYFSSSGANLYLQLFFNGTNYYSAVTYQTATSFAVGTTGISAGTTWMVGITGNTSNCQYDIDLTTPLGTNWKIGQSTFTAGDNTNSYGGSTRLWNTNATTSTGFSLYPSTGTMTGGKIYVYGYRS